MGLKADSPPTPPPWMLSERAHVATPCAQRALKAERCLGTIAAISTAAVGSVIVSVTALVDTAASAVAALNQPAEELVDDPTFAHTSEVNAHARVRLGARGSGCIKAELVPARDTAQLVHACGWERAPASSAADHAPLRGAIVGSKRPGSAACAMALVLNTSRSGRDRSNETPPVNPFSRLASDAAFHSLIDASQLKCPRLLPPLPRGLTCVPFGQRSCTNPKSDPIH